MQYQLREDSEQRIKSATELTQAIRKTSAMRVDRFKTPILKQTKVHRVVFRDEIEKESPLSDIHIVENWKKYNILNDTDSQTCACNIF